MKGLREPFTRRTMPWDEIESGKYDEIKSKVTSLIRLRNEHDELTSNDIEYIRHTEYPRLINYRKSGKAEIFLNAEDTPCKIEAHGKVLFENGYENGVLKQDGILITEI